jgi:toxin ParE1/3/4
MRIKWTAEAETHLDGIYHYIAKDSSLYASRTLDKLTRRAEHLIDYPRVGRIVPKYDDPNLRELIVGSYRVIYRITSDHIEILAVFHGAQQLPDSL